MINDMGIPNRATNRKAEMPDNYLKHKQKPSTKKKTTGKKRSEYRCGKCPFIGKTKNEYNKHRIAVHVTKRFQCPFCDHTDKLSANMKTHMTRVFFIPYDSYGMITNLPFLFCDLALAGYLAACSVGQYLQVKTH